MNILRAKAEHIIYDKQISLCIDESVKVRGTSIARRTHEYLATKIENGNAVIALDENQFAGFCYIEVWGHGKYVAHSGLIVAPEFRGRGLAKKIKKEVFNISLEQYPKAKIFGITTGQAVMKINYELGYKPVHFSELTDDPEFWKGCQTFKNFNILTRTERKLCLCTGMLHDPNEKKEITPKSSAFLSGLFKKNKK